MSEQIGAWDLRVRELLQAKQNEQAAKVALEAVGAEILGWLCGVFLDDRAAQAAYDDLCSELPHELWAFRDECPLRCWVYGLARRVAFRHLRSPESEEAPLGATAPPRQIRTEQTTELSGSLLSRLRAKLDPEERMVLILRVDRRMTWEEVAHVMENPSVPATLRESADRLRRYFHDIRERVRALSMQEA